MRAAAEIVDKVFVGTAKWAELFQPHDFFSKYRYYLQITASSSNADVQLKWYVAICVPLAPLSASRDAVTHEMGENVVAPRA